MNKKKNILSLLIKRVICDLVHIHWYESCSGTIDIESNDDGNFVETKNCYCALCGKYKEVVKVKRDIVLDDPSFIELLNEYVELINLGVNFSYFGIFLSNNDGKSIDVIKKIESYNKKCFEISVRFPLYVNIPNRLYREAKIKNLIIEK